MPSRIYHRFVYKAPSSDYSLLTLILPFKVILSMFRLFSDVWSEKDALLKRLLKIHSNPPILYYDFKEILSFLYTIRVEAK